MQLPICCQLHPDTPNKSGFHTTLFSPAWNHARLVHGPGVHQAMELDWVPFFFLIPCYLHFSRKSALLRNSLSIFFRWLNPCGELPKQDIDSGLLRWYRNQDTDCYIESIQRVTADATHSCVAFTFLFIIAVRSWILPR